MSSFEENKTSTIGATSPAESIDATDFVAEPQSQELLEKELAEAYKRLEKTVPGIKARLELLSGEDREQLIADLERVVNLDEKLPQ